MKKFIFNINQSELTSKKKNRHCKQGDQKSTFKSQATFVFRLNIYHLFHFISKNALFSTFAYRSTCIAFSPNFMTSLYRMSLQKQLGSPSARIGFVSNHWAFNIQWNPNVFDHYYDFPKNFKIKNFKLNKLDNI